MKPITTPSLAALVVALLLSGCDQITAFLEEPAEETGESTEEHAKSGSGVTRMATVTQLSAQEYDRFVGMKDRVVVVDFYADWCPPCRELAPKLERIAGEFGGRVVIGKLNVDHAGDLPKSKGVSGIPDVRIFVNGRQVDKFVGNLSEGGIRQKLEAQASKVSMPETPQYDEETSSGETMKPMDKDWLPEGMQKR